MVMTSGAAAAKCVLSKLVEIPVTMAGLRPMVHARINGRDALIEADSGAFFSWISPGSAAEYGLTLDQLPNALRGFYVTGIGGSVQPYLTTVKNFSFAGVTFPRVQFLVGGSEVGSVGLLGQNVLALEDTEFDLGRGMIRLMKTRDCSRTNLAYWVQPGSAYSVVATESAPSSLDHIVAPIAINGFRIRALFDTGAPTSFINLKAAARIGLKPDGPGVVSAGEAGGIGRRRVKTWIGPVTSVKIGEEDIRNTRVRFGGDLNDVDMLIGADFFVAHHLYWARKLQKLFFTFNGGHVFDLRYLRDDEDDAVVATGVPAATVTGPEPADAGGFSRRGQARAAGGDFAGGLSDLDHALALEPDNVEYLRQRAAVRPLLKQSGNAIDDLDHLLKIKPDDVDALLMRAALRFTADGSDAQVRSDIDKAAAVAPVASNLRLAIAHFYDRLDAFAPAVEQYGLWIAAHRQDSHRPEALNGRCWARAMLGSELALALKDCNAALAARPHEPGLLDSRGLVRVRMGDYARAIADYDEALDAVPDIAWSYYGRGIAKLRLGQKDAGEADLAKARKIDPKLPGKAEKLGIKA